MGYNLLINGVYWGYNPLTNHLLTSWDIQVGVSYFTPFFTGFWAQLVGIRFSFTMFHHHPSFCNSAKIARAWHRTARFSNVKKFGDLDETSDWNNKNHRLFTRFLSGEITIISNLNPELDDFPRDRGKNRKCLKSPPSEFKACHLFFKWAPPLTMLKPQIAKQFTRLFPQMIHYLEDHPRTCKWSITMVNASPLSRVVGPLQIGLFMAYKWGWS